MTNKVVDSIVMPKILKPTNIFFNVLKNCSQASSQGSSSMFGSDLSSNNSTIFKYAHESEKKQEMFFYTARRYRSRKSLISDRIYQQRRYLPRYRLPFVNPEYIVENKNKIQINTDNDIKRKLSDKIQSQSPNIAQDTCYIDEARNLNSRVENASLTNEMDDCKFYDKINAKNTKFKKDNREENSVDNKILFVNKDVAKKARHSKFGDIKIRFTNTLEALRRMELASRMLEQQKKKLDIRKSEMEKSLKRLRMIYKFVKNMEESDDLTKLEISESQDIALENPRLYLEDNNMIVDKVEKFYSRGQNFSRTTTNNDMVKSTMNDNALTGFIDKNISRNIKIGSENLERAHEVCYRLELPFYEGLPPMPAHQSPVDLSACTYLVLRQI